MLGTPICINTELWDLGVVKENTRPFPWVPTWDVFASFSFRLKTGYVHPLTEVLAVQRVKRSPQFKWPGLQPQLYSLDLGEVTLFPYL